MATQGRRAFPDVAPARDHDRAAPRTLEARSLVNGLVYGPPTIRTRRKRRRERVLPLGLILSGYLAALASASWLVLDLLGWR